MLMRGIRGATTLENNDKKSIKEATVELIDAILDKNNIEIENIAFVIFTVTSDIDADFPAKYAREYCGFENVPMMCYREMDVKGAITKCLRILICVNTTKNQKDIKHQYLKGAVRLRPDIKE